MPGSAWLTILETKRGWRDVRQGNYTLFHAWVLAGLGWCWLVLAGCLQHENIIVFYFHTASWLSGNLPPCAQSQPSKYLAISYHSCIYFH